MELIGFIVGGAICYFVWPPMKMWVFLVTEQCDIPPPNGVKHEEWLQLIAPIKYTEESLGTENRKNWVKRWIDELKHRPGTPEAWLGVLERILSFVAFYVSAPILIAGWFAFKVASKWQVWSHIVQVPKKLGDSEEDLSSLTARYRWSSVLLMRFLIGTLSNVMIGIILAHMLKYYLSP